MSRLETLAPHNPIDFDISAPSFAHEAGLPWTVNDILSAQPPLVVTADAQDPHDDEGEIIFPDLPPLHSGHPEVHLRAGIMRAARLAADHVPDAEKAFFVADLGEVYTQHMRWRAALPDIQPFYAVKCNPDPYVIRLLAALGAGFDCASNNEIAQVLAVGGVAPSSIIFANPCKATSFIRAAAQRGVDLMTFDNLDELAKIARTHPRAKCVVRILTDDSKSLCAFGIKFGAPLTVVPALLARARELGLDVVGVSFHVGSGCYDPNVYGDALARAARVFGMGAEAGYAFTLLDVGGGFEDARFEHAAGVIREAMEVYFPKRERERRGVRVIAEPGRFYVAKAFRLAAHVIARRAPGVQEVQESARREVEEGARREREGLGVRDEKEKEKEEAPAVMYYINDGVYGAFNCILFDHQVVHPYVLSMGGSFHVPPSISSSFDDEDQSNTTSSTTTTTTTTTSPSASANTLTRSSVWGPTCDSIDCVSPSTLLPSGLRVGDWLGFDNMGAYTVCAASRFNGFEVSNVVYTSGGAGSGGGGGAGAGSVAEGVRRALGGWAGKAGVV